MLEEWAPVDENAIYAEEDAVGGLTGPRCHRQLVGLQHPATGDRGRRVGFVVRRSVDGNVDEDTNEGVDKAKAAEAMTVALAPLEGGYIALEGDMPQPLPG